MATTEQLIALHQSGMLLNIIYALHFTPGELELHAQGAETHNEPGVAEILRAAAAALIATQEVAA